jgi:hypothetical protein
MIVIITGNSTQNSDEIQIRTGNSIQLLCRFGIRIVVSDPITTGTASVTVLKPDTSNILGDTIFRYRNLNHSVLLELTFVVRCWVTRRASATNEKYSTQTSGQANARESLQLLPP